MFLFSRVASIAFFVLLSSVGLGQVGGVGTFFKDQHPVAPTTLTATAASASQINLSWVDNSNNETGFNVERSPDGATGWSSITTTAANATSYADSSLAEGAQYYYRVHAVNVSINSTDSNTANAITIMNAPTGLTPAVASASQINLSWTDNSTVETGYQVERSPDNATWTTIATTAANATSYANTGLGACTTYYYRIKAVNAITSSAYAGSVNGLTQPNHGNVDFYSSGTWYVPGCIYSVTIYVWGGGGGGGSGYYYAGAGGGGGGGAAGNSYGVSPGQGISYTVGGGGPVRSAGGTTSCAGMNAYGGNPGGNSTTNCSGVGGGGAGGGANGGSSNWAGGNGGAGTPDNSCSSSTKGSGGGGGASANGGPGNGGGGGCGACDGATGGTGMVRIYY